MQTYTLSEAGHEHRCEDRFIIAPHPGNSGTVLCAVSDGQGGRSGGMEAAGIAVETSISLASLLPPSGLFHPNAWPPIIAGADDSVQDDAQAGYATLIAFAVSDRSVCGASVGDSAVFLRSGGQDRLLTDEQRKNPPIGTGAAYPVSFSAELRSPWTILAVTDGVYRYLEWGAITNLILRYSGRELLEALLKAQKDSHGGLLGDDFTAVLIQG